MSTVTIAHRQHETGDPGAFIPAYWAGKRASRSGEDTHALYRHLLAQGDAAAVAGYLQGLAAAAREQLPEHPVDCPCRRCVWDRADLMRQLRRMWREQVAA